MNFNRTSWIVATGCLALILLIFFQVNWLQHSRRLIEQQFDQKVTMAICSAIDELSRRDGKSVSVEFNCVTDEAACGSGILQTNVDEQELEAVLNATLDRYGIDLDYQYNILPHPDFLQLNASTSYCSTMQPLTKDNRSIQVTFSGREAYVIEQMGFMTISSIMILLFVGSVFVLTLYKLVQQRKWHALSIDFFNNMAHEFRTPLTNIQLATGLLKRNNRPEKKERYLQVIDSENSRLLEQVERMLHIAKVGRGEYRMELEPLDLSTLVEEVVQDMQIQIAEREGRVDIQGQATPIFIQGDRLHLSNAIRNLLDNALKYCDRKPHISIQLQQNEQQAILSLKDNGIGICEQQKKLIFAPFRRGQAAQQTHQKGFGLGLSYVQKVLEFHRGAIQLDSSPQGSCFRVSLPLKSVSHG